MLLQKRDQGSLPWPGSNFYSHLYGYIFTGYFFLNQANVSITYSFPSYQVDFVLIFSHVIAFQSNGSPLLMLGIQEENISFIMFFQDISVFNLSTRLLPFPWGLALELLEHAQCCFDGLRVCCDHCYHERS